MPTSSTDAGARLEGGTLHLAGRLDRHHVPALWPSLPRGGYAAIDLGGVTALDTVGLALVAHLASQAPQDGGAALPVLGAPAGYAELCAAYRLSPDLR
ncbi:STAS domain-containing protein [Coralloluteibacterium thermophilus]|uniref:Lipid asymmetry maintenance protein MlaB n=1 Tax=Coralloluteibacterium thermophilum TaxID=2707049 RepID=A0ABV9NPW3_9GAMM